MFGHWALTYRSDRVSELSDERLEVYIAYGQWQRSYQATPMGFSYWDIKIGRARREQAKRQGVEYSVDECRFIPRYHPVSTPRKAGDAGTKAPAAGPQSPRIRESGEARPH